MSRLPFSIRWRSQRNGVAEGEGFLQQRPRLRLATAERALNAIRVRGPAVAAVLALFGGFAGHHVLLRIKNDAGCR